MKFYKIFAVLLISACFTQVGLCSTSSFQKTLQNRIKLQDSESVINKANSGEYSSQYSGMQMDPYLNSMMNSSMNMMQNGSVNTFQQMDQARQQADYAKQQKNYTEQEDE